MSSSIVPISKTFVQDNRQKLLTHFWEKQTVKPQPEFKEWTHFALTDIEATIAYAIDQAEEVICLQTPFFQAGTAIEEACLRAINERNVRLYLLIDQRPDDQDVVSLNDLKALAGQALIRCGASVVGTFVLIDPKKEKQSGFIYNHHLLDNAVVKQKGLLTALSASQLTNLFAFFCQTFWEKAGFEILQESHLEMPKQVEGSPFNKIGLPTPYFGWDGINGFLARKLAGATDVKMILHRMDNNQTNPLKIPVDKLKEARILCTLQQRSNDLVKQLAEKGNHLEAIESTLANFVILDNNEIYWLPILDMDAYKQENLVYLLKLNEGQCKDLLAYANDLTNKSKYHFHAKKQFQAVEAPLLLVDDLSKSIEISQEAEAEPAIKKVELGALKNPVWDEFMPEEDLYALEVKYEIKLEPQQLPQGATDAPLYKKWIAAQSRFSKTVDELAQKRDELYKAVEEIPDTLKSKILGGWTKAKKRLIEVDSTIKELKKKDIAVLQTAEVNRCIQQLDRAINVFNEENFSVLSDIKVKEAKIEFEENQQKYKKEVSKLEQRKQNLTRQWGNMYDNMDMDAKGSYLESERNRMRKEFMEQQEWKEGGWEDLMVALQRVAERQSRDGRDAGGVDLLVKEMKDIDAPYEEYLQGNSQEINVFSDQLRNISKRLAFIEKEMGKSFTSQTNRIRSQQSKLQTVSTKSGGRKKSSLSSILKNRYASNTALKQKDNSAEHEEPTIVVNIVDLPLFSADYPNESLPRRGHLFTWGNKRYLAINSWSEYDWAKEDAQKLGAILCATKEEPVTA